MSALQRAAKSLFTRLRISSTPPLRRLCTHPDASPPANSTATATAIVVPTMESVNQLFAEANMSLQDAQESLGTVYFELDFQDAKLSTKNTLQAFQQLLHHSTPKQRQLIRQANDPKMAQLRHQFDTLQHNLIHDD